LNSQILAGIVLGVVVAAASYVVRFLTLSGAITAAGLATIVYGAGEWKWTVPILIFFLLSSLLSRIGRTKKKRFDSIFEKSSTRDYGQVLANGGVGGIVAFFQLVFPSIDFYPMFVGSIAAVTADTWGTELGLLGKGKTLSVVTLMQVDRGTSGGVSLLGLLGGALGAFVIALTSNGWAPGIGWLIRIAAAGTAASLVDSFLGATLQAEYECVVCGRTTERVVHCGMPSKLIRGRPFVNNDAVNWACAFAGAIIATLVAS